MTKIGITGGIGCGKSYVCRRMEALFAIPVYDCDSRAKELMHNDVAIRKGLIALCGEAVYDAAGTLDRAALAARIFADPAMLAQVNALVHPRVEADFLAWAERQRGGVVALESAILFSSGLSRAMDCVIRVTAPEEVRIGRVLSRDNCSREQVLARMRNQQAEDGAADFLIVNDGVADVDEQLVRIINNYKQQ